LGSLPCHIPSRQQYNWANVADHSNYPPRVSVENLTSIR
jgi:hypothetical protein